MINIYFIIILIFFLSLFAAPANMSRVTMFDFMIYFQLFAFILQGILFYPLSHSLLFQDGLTLCPLCQRESILEQISGYKYGLDCEHCGFISAGKTFSISLDVDDNGDSNADVQMDDPVFGSLEFASLKGLDRWTQIPENEHDPMIVVDATVTGPTQNQREFYAELRGKLKDYEAACKVFISSQGTPPPNLDDMTIYSVQIGDEQKLNSGQFVIELSDSNAYEIHKVEFKEKKPSTYAIDD